MSRVFSILIVWIASLVFLSCQSQPKAAERAELHLKLGISFYESGAYPQALAALQKAEALNPKSPQVQNNLGLVYFMRERYDLSEKYIRKALELDPKYTDSRNNLVRVLIEENELEKAQVEMDRVFADLTYGGLHRAHSNQGLIYFKQKNFQLAEKAFLTSIEYQRDSCSSYNYWGRSIFELGDYVRAARALDRAIAICQKSMVDEPHYYSALAYYRSGDKDRSRVRFEEIVRLYVDGKYQEKARQMLELIGKAH